MEILVCNDRQAMGQTSAQIAAKAIQEAIETNGGARIVVATGSSQFEVLQSLVAHKEIDWSKVDAFHLDEYIGIDSNHPASFCGYLRQRFADLVPLRSFFYLDGKEDAHRLCERATQSLRTAPIDLAMIGIGENAHLAFNDPPADFETTAAYHVVRLDEACRTQQVGEGWFPSLADVPEFAISMTIFQILQSKQIVCSVPDARKAVAVRDSVQGPLSPHVPASILRKHSNTTLVLDSAAASLLDNAHNR